jgi:hypothetical protein
MNIINPVFLFIIFTFFYTGVFADKSEEDKDFDQYLRERAERRHEEKIYEIRYGKDLDRTDYEREYFPIDDDDDDDGDDQDIDVDIHAD